MADEAAQWAAMPDEVQALKAEHDRLVEARRVDRDDQDARESLRVVNLALREATQEFRAIGEFAGTRTPLMVAVADGGASDEEV